MLAARLFLGRLARLVGRKRLLPGAVGFVAVSVGTTGVLWATAAALGGAALAGRRLASTPAPPIA